MAKIKGSTARFQYIEIGNLSVHPDIQREFDQHHAERLAKGFDPNALRDLLVIPDPRHKGKFLIFDGQHRWWAACKIYQSTWSLPCRVYDVANLSELADIQIKINGGSKAWRGFDAFRMKVIRGDIGAIEIKASVESAGLRIAPMKVDGVVAAVVALESVYARGGKSLIDRELSVLIAAFGKDSDAFQATTLRGLAMLLAKHNGDIDDAILIARLKKTTDAAGLIGRSKSYAKATHVSTPAATAQLIVQAYNSGRRPDNRLPNFHS